MNQDAYWISPKGKVLPFSQFSTHINQVISNPKKFGETDLTIKASYDKFNEKMPHEGKGREEIIVRILKRGYIRIRKYTSWSIQLNKLNQKQDDYIWAWSKSIKTDDPYADVSIHELMGNKMTKTSFDKISEDTRMDELLNTYLDRLYEENTSRLNKIMFVESVDELDDFIDINEASLEGVCLSRLGDTNDGCV